VIGVGAGDPEYMTVQAIRALNELDVLYVLDKGDELTAARRELVARFREQPLREVTITDPPRGRGAEAVAAWRAERVQLIAAALEGGVGGFLAWGDPTLYDALIDVLVDVGVEFDVIPGISAVSALCARHGVMLNRVGRSVLITTGRRLLADGWPSGIDDVVVMLDFEQAFLSVEADLIYWGAFLGTPDEILLSGRLPEVREEIARVRAEAREPTRKGWMFDTYLLRRN
jgi:precorrin-6A synthase